MDENPIKVEYDRESDILYIRFKEAEIVDTKMLSEDAYINLDKDGNLVGIWRVSQNATLPISKDIAEKLKLILESPA